MKTYLVFAFTLGVIMTAMAHTSIEQDFVCPIDGAKFKQRMDASGTSFGMRLDLKQVGPIAAPWAVPQCPKCKFILYQETFDEKDLEKLKPYILSDAYQKAAKNNSSYYGLAHIMEFQGKSPLGVAHTYLKASWQVESDAAKCRDYQEEAYKRFAKIAKEMKPSENDFVTVAILAGELERRLGKFEDAGKRFNELKNLEVFKAENLQEIVKRELQLVGAKDSAPHGINEESERAVQEEKEQKR